MTVKRWLATSVVLATFIIAANAGTSQAAISPAGVYIGTIAGTCGSGGIAVLVGGDLRAEVLAYNKSDRAVHQQENLQVGADGRLVFSGFLQRPVQIEIAFGRSIAEGTIQGSCDGTITAKKESLRGFMVSTGGYYTGIHNGSIYEIQSDFACVCAGLPPPGPVLLPWLPTLLDD